MLEIMHVLSCIAPRASCGGVCASQHYDMRLAAISTTYFTINVTTDNVK